MQENLLPAMVVYCLSIRLYHRNDFRHSKMASVQTQERPGAWKPKSKTAPRTIAAQAEELKSLDKGKTLFFQHHPRVPHPADPHLGPLEQVIAEQPPPTIFRRRLNGVLKNARHLGT